MVESPEAEFLKLVAKGKTKNIFQTRDPSTVVIESRDDITAGDGARHDLIPGKGAWSTTTTCNVFTLLKACGIPVGFYEQVSINRFTAPFGQMFPFEVIVRRESHGSDLQRNPHLKKGNVYPRLKVEFFLKTSGKKWKDHNLVCDDPLMMIQSECEASYVLLYDPHKPIHGQEPFLKLPFAEVFAFQNVDEVLAKMCELAKRIFLVLEKAWQLQGRRLVDFKIEFAILASDIIAGPSGPQIPVEKIFVGDVIDNDSWRVLQDGQYIDKQLWRDGAPSSEMAAKLELVARLTSNFSLPQQRLIIWTGSDKDDITSIAQIIGDLTGPNPHMPFSWYKLVGSWHKKPVQSYLALQRAIQQYPDSVVLSLVGMSNGAGPTLSASCTVPVITVPANAKSFPDDVWSSLRTPSQVPVLTCLEPANAVLAALQILAIRSPYLYMCLRLRQEERLPNIIEI